MLIAITGSVAATRQEAELQAMPMLVANELRRKQGIVLPHLPDTEAFIAHFGGVVPAGSELASRYIIGGIDEVSARLQRQAEERAGDRT